MSPTAIPFHRADTDALVRRATYGPDGRIEALAHELGRDAFLESQLAPESIDDGELELLLAARYPEAELSAHDAMTLFDAPMRRSREIALLRALASRRQLLERLVAFWNDHFHVDGGRGECRVLKGIEDRSAIRAHALGDFRELLLAVTRSGAMLEYLDNRRNVKAAPNENFARELLELHTLGVGHYDERDVREVARCFTGWTIRPRDDARFGEFHFDASEHDDGAKTVLGRTIAPSGGEQDGLTVLDLVARHPATARRIARKLCVRFVRESPDERDVDAVACAFADSDGSLRATARAALDARDFGGPPSRKYLRPFDFVVATLRATRASVTDPRGLVDELDALGDAPFSWPTPDGPPDARTWWESSLLLRWRFVERYMRGEIEGVAFDPATLLAGATRADVVERIDACLAGGTMSAADRAMLHERADAASELDSSVLRRLLTLAACSPSCQSVTT